MIYQYPFESHSFEIIHEAERLQLHYLDEGPKDAPVVVMLHGNPTWSYYYRHVIESLKGPFRCIVPDHMGMGLSSKPENYPYNLARRIEDVEALLKSLDVKSFSLIVHDWGGAIGSGVATNDPSRVNKIVYLNTGAFIDSHIPWQIALCRFPWWSDFCMRGLNLFAWPATFMASSKGLSKEIKEAYLAPYKSYVDRVAIARFVQDIPMEKNHPTYATLKGIEGKLPNLKCSKLLLWGAEDFCFSMHFHKRFQEIFPDAQSHVYTDAGHYVLEDAHGDIEKRIREFLQ